MQKIAVLGVGRDINLDKSSDACRIVAQVVSDNGAFLSILSWFVGMPMFPCYMCRFVVTYELLITRPHISEA